MPPSIQVVPTPSSADCSGVPPLGGARNATARPLLAMIALASALATTACQCCDSNSTTSTATTGPAAIPSAELAELARGHSDKIEFAWYAATFHRLDPPVKAFVQHMAEDHKRMLQMLSAWAGENKVDLSIQYSTDAAGRARQAMDKSQEQVIRGDADADFQRDLLIQMWQDYDWHRSLAQALAEKTTDRQLKAYLEDSVHTHTAGIKQIRDLLARYKFE